MSRKYSYLLLISFLGLLISCDNNPSDPNNPLVGSWRLVEMNITFEGVTFNYAPEDIGMSQTLRINSDGLYSTTSTDPHGTQTESGTWQYSGSSITITSNGESFVMPCTVSGTTLSITYENGFSEFDILGRVVMIYHRN